MKHIKNYKIYESEKIVITDKDEILKNMDIQEDPPYFDKTPNSELDGYPVREISKDELNKQIDYASKVATFTYYSPKEIPDSMDYPNETESEILAIYNMTGSWLKDPTDFINGELMIKRNGIIYVMEGFRKYFIE